MDGIVSELSLYVCKIISKLVEKRNNQTISPSPFGLANLCFKWSTTFSYIAVCPQPCLLLKHQWKAEIGQLLLQQFPTTTLKQ